MTNDWTDEQNDAIVADYFKMLGDDVAGRRYNKREHNRLLQKTIGRSSGSIEFKHRNISAVLKSLGEDWIRGYQPEGAFHFQVSLVGAVERWLKSHPEWLARRPELLAASLGASGQSPSVVGEGSPLRIGPPPTHSNAPPPRELERMLDISRKYGAAERDANNRALGEAGEARVLEHERAILLAAGRTDLAERIRWVSQVDGDGAGYDIRSFECNGRERLIEVKTTNGWERTPFYITSNELGVGESNREDWLLLRLWDFGRDPRAFELRPPLDAHVSLMATSYRASFS